MITGYRVMKLLLIPLKVRPAIISWPVSYTHLDVYKRQVFIGQQDEAVILVFAQVVLLAAACFKAESLDVRIPLLVGIIKDCRCLLYTSCPIDGVLRAMSLYRKVV